ncbi:DUF4073 domain-containing protein [Paenibacillus xylanilyticus]|uniref:DUF4073 domain-containing protein n=1 Tax=Paenibacillus xylanilyticus TaxID=248903 RepID=A0A7Y6BZA4_9BACL|nr:DUF4073 domain-containing protein [Paenibacillus xylanilyticus]NUU77328.1 DUF4073 domain-containing protein [Paenibacillus xylanilyticus]
MLYRKLVSCLLIAVLFLQVFSVGGVANAASPLGDLNEAKRNADIAEVQRIIDQNGFLTIPDGYTSMDENQKGEIARGMVYLLPQDYSYDSISQAQYFFNVLYSLVLYPKQTDNNIVQQMLNDMYHLFGQATENFQSELSIRMHDAGVKHDMLLGADKQIFASWMQFSNATVGSADSINYETQIDYMISELSNYHGINAAFNAAEMESVLFNLYLTEIMFNQFIETSPDSGALPLPVHLGMMSAMIDNAQKRAELAQWMIDQRPIGGYNTVAEVQTALDTFFAPAAPLVTADDEANVILGADGTMEYSQNDDGNWSEYISSNPPVFNGNVTVKVRVKTNGNTPAGLAATLNFTENSGTDPLEPINLAKTAQNVAGVLTAVQNPQLGVNLPADFSSWTNNEKESMAEFLIYMNGSKEYVSKDQVQYVIDLVNYPRGILQTRDLLSVEQKVTTYFGMLMGLPEVFSANMDSSIQSFYSIGKKYRDLSAVDKQILAYNIKFDIMRSSIPVYQYSEQLSTELSTYGPINTLTNQTKMYNALVRLRLLQKESTQYNLDASTVELMEVFSLNLDKVDGITFARYKELAQWMIDKRPVSGYTGYSEIQETFNAFFAPPVSPPAPNVQADDINNTIIGADSTMEYSLNGGAQWFSYVPEENPRIDGAYTVLVRVKANGNVPAGESATLTFTENVLRTPMEQLNQAVDAENVDDVLSIIRNSPELVTLPAGFNDLTLEEQLAVAQAVIDLLPDEYDYDVEGQVRYTVELAYEAVLAYKATSQSEMQNHLDNFYLKLSQVDDYFSIEEFEEFRMLSKKYVDGSVVDQKMIAYLARLVMEQEELSVDQAVLGMVMILTISPSFNVDTTGEMSQTLVTLLMIQQEIEEFNNQAGEGKFEDFPLNFSRLTELSSDESKIEKLAQWMLDKRPANGYVSYTEVQSAFDEFFEPKTPVTNPPSSGGSTGGGSSSTPVTSAPATNQETLTVDVNGTNGTNLVKTTITRTTNTDGKVKDLVTMSEATARESVEKAKQLGMDTARIVIPDAKDSVSETRIELPKAAVKLLNDGGLKLEISTENAIISIPTSSTAGFDQDLYFRIVPMKQESQRQEVEERAKKEQLIQQIKPNADVNVLARPVEIETNMQSREVTLTLPLRDSLPTDAAARQQALDNLAVYIEHSDGTKELIQGKLVKLNDGSEGIEFTVSKFSTFTLVVVDGLKASQDTHKPYINGFGDEFRPDAFVTRAQMAAMLARNLSEGTETANSVTFTDVAATHWAASNIEQTQAAGIMNGMSSTLFAPEGSITRAQMAAIAYRWMQQQSNAAAASEPGASFADVSTDFWAAEAIAYVQSAGLMTGYTDGTFKPDNKLTRAEAVKVLNVLFKRTPAPGMSSVTFTDVPATHWAYADIEAAAHK